MDGRVGFDLPALAVAIRQMTCRRTCHPPAGTWCKIALNRSLSSGSAKGNCVADRFETTRWSQVLTAAKGGEGSVEALEWLCRTYWHPLYGFIRRQGHDAETARDLTQSFFLSLLGRKSLQRIDPSE